MESTRPLGKTMLMLAWLAVLGLLTLVFGRWEDQQSNPNQVPDSRSMGDATRVTLTANRYHHYVATGQINGRPVTFLLDTGATTVSVPAHLAAGLGLQGGQPLQSSTANGTVTVYATRIDSLQLGDIHLQDLRGTINPGMQEDEILLGMSALRQIEWHQKGNQLTLIQHH